MKPLDRDLFIKLMGKTTSDSDGEALAFLRRANAMLKAANLTWSEIVSDQAKAERKLFEAFTHRDLRPTGTARYGRPVQRKPRDTTQHRDPWIGQMLNELRTREHTMSFIMFLSGVNQHWKEKGWISTAQLTVIQKAHAMGRSPF